MNTPEFRALQAFLEACREMRFDPQRLNEAMEFLTPRATTNEALRAERDEADRRAGAAERTCTEYHAEVVRLHARRDAMKAQWGVDRGTSFDQIWEEALQFKKQAKHLVEDCVDTVTNEDPRPSYEVKNDLTTHNLVSALVRLLEGRRPRDE